MRGQHPGLPQPQSRQQSGYDEMQTLQHQLMYKQLQGLQRQPIWQSGEELKNHNLLRQMSAVTRQTVSGQLSGVNGMPLHDASNFTWQSEYPGNDMKVLHSSQMLMAGNMNLPQRAGHSMPDLSSGFALPQDQAQGLQPFGFIPQHPDQSLYGLPVSGNRGWSNPYSQLHGVSQRQDISDATSKGGANVPFNSIRTNQSLCNQLSLTLPDSHIASRQDFPDKKISGISADSSKNGGLSKCEQANPSGKGMQFNELLVQQDQSYRQRHQEKAALVQTPSSVSLDPTEQKILFSSDDDMSWDIFGMNNNVSGNLIGSSSDGNLFPSFQGGSWSALMQSAVAEVSSSDAELKEEWSGLSLQKTVPSSNLVGISKPQADWFTNGLHASTSAPLGSFSTFQIGNTSITDCKVADYQQPSIAVLQQETSKYGSENKGGHDGTTHGLMQQTPLSCSSNAHNTYSQIQKVSACSSDSQYNCKEDAWVSNKLPQSHVKSLIELSDPGSSMQHSKMNDSVKSIYADKVHSNSFWMDAKQEVSSTSNLERVGGLNSGFISSQMQTALGNSTNSAKHPNNYNSNEHKFDQGKPLMIDSSQITMGKENLGTNPLLLNKRSQPWEPLPNTADKVSGDAYEMEQPHGSHKEQSNDNSYVSAQSCPDSSDSGGVSRAGAENHSTVHSSQNMHDHAGKKNSVPQKFQYHPMGNVDFITEVNDSQKKSLFSQEHGHVSLLESKNYQVFRQHSSASRVMDTKKDWARGVERNARDPNQSNCRQDIQSLPFIGGSSVSSPQSKGTGQTSQNMLELINTVDQSKASDARKKFADQNMFYRGPNSSDGLSTNPQYNQAPPLQGFRLQLGPPFEKQSISNSHVHLSPQAVTDNSVQPHCQDGEETSTWSNSSIPDQSMHLRRDAPSVEEFDDQFIEPQVTTKESSGSIMHDKHMGRMHLGQSFAQNQVHSQQTFVKNLNLPNEQSVHANFSTRNNYEAGGHLVPNNSQVSNVITGPSQNSFADLPVMPLALGYASTQDIRSSLGSQSGCAMPQSRSTNFASKTRSSNQQLADPQSSIHPSLNQQSGLSGNAHHLWSNLSAQRISNNLPQKNMPSLPHQINSNNFQILRPSPKADMKDNIKGHSSTTVGACLGNSQNQTSEEQLGQDNSIKQLTPSMLNASHGKGLSVSRGSDASSFISSQSTVRIEQGESNKHGQSLLSNFQRVHQVPNNDKHNVLFRPLDAQNRNFSLLQQVQARKALEADQSNRIGKRLKSSDASLDSQLFTEKTLQNLKTVDGYSVGVGSPGSSADNELSAVVQRGSFPANSRMLSFSSAAIEDQNLSRIIRDPGMNVPFQNTGDSKPSDSLNGGQSIAVASTFSAVKSIEDGHARPQFVQSCAERHGNLIGDYAHPLHDKSGNVHLNEEIASEHYLNPPTSDSTSSPNAISNICQSMSDLPSNEHSMSAHTLSAEVFDGGFSQRSKKRKRTELLPWHEEILGGFHWIQRIRMADTDWAHATDKLPEKVEDAEIMAHAQSIFQSRKRLIVTTHLMQQLLPPVPAAILTEPATNGYESIIFLAAKLGLGESCSCISFLANGAGASSAVTTPTFGKLRGLERTGDQNLLKLVENFVVRSGKLENDLLRYEKRASFLDVRIECQDLERFSIINRFARFHGRNQAEGMEGSSSSETSRKTFTQRYVTAIAMPDKPPEGLVCLSL